jgi:TDG/mug DNA glycosylase family protein
MVQSPRARPRRLPDRIGSGVQLLFVGINPSLRSVEYGHHFAVPGNRFWRLLFDARLVGERLTFGDDERLVEWGYGLTNIVARPTASMAGLSAEEFRAGGARLRRLVRLCRPASVALVGVTVYRALFPGSRGPVPLGLPTGELSGTVVYVVPNPSGRNAHFSYDEMRAAYARLPVSPTAEGAGRRS